MMVKKQGTNSRGFLGEFFLENPPCRGVVFCLVWVSLELGTLKARSSPLRWDLGRWSLGGVMDEHLATGRVEATHHHEVVRPVGSEPATVTQVTAKQTTQSSSAVAGKK